MMNWFMITPLFVTSVKKNSVKIVRNHCHLSGKFRGAAHEVCNLKYKVPTFFKGVFHNLSGYDSLLFIKKLGNSDGDISCIPHNEENYIPFTNRSSLINLLIRKEER